MPNPFNKESKLFWGLDIGGFELKPCRDIYGSLKCYERTEYLINNLNKTYFDVYTALDQPSYLWVTTKLRSKFEGHSSPNPQCGDETPGSDNTWIQYPGDPGSNGEIPLIEKLLLGTTENYGDCFHPNEKGAVAIAEEVNQAALRLGR